jgi:hypothetical protein
MSYDPTLGRWLQEDPSDYIDGPNAFELEKSSPADSTDPSGLWTADSTPWTMEKAEATAQAGDTWSGLAKKIIGSDAIQGADRAFKEGDKVDVTPLLKHLQDKYEANVPKNVASFKSNMGATHYSRGSIKL